VSESNETLNLCRGKLFLQEIKAFAKLPESFMGWRVKTKSQELHRPLCLSLLQLCQAGLIPNSLSSELRTFMKAELQRSE